MVEVRTVRDGEVRAAWEFEVEYVGSDEDFEAFRERYREYPDLFVAAVEDGELLGVASGRPTRLEEAAGDLEADGQVTLTAIGTRNDREREGIGTRLLSAFEERASEYGEVVGMAAAGNVEEFYEQAGYDPTRVLLQANVEDLPADYRDYEALIDERDVDGDTRFLYVGFEKYGDDTAERLREAFGAYHANALYEKEL
jgi:ribosomal protein S18 acetylase RimI-like enzyme